jgi:wyosine [tRNA(Phe)-imidazoG37] synthetase (radical SAM superfamily)
MKPFWVSEVQERYGEKTLYVNPLPEKICTFDCVFCPAQERTINKTDNSFHFKETEVLLQEIESILKSTAVDTVFIMPDGEGLANEDLESIINLIKSYHCKVKIITNGYILNHPKYKQLMLKCDEVIGELMTITEEDFQKLQRPINGYTLKAYVESMAAFRQAYSGEFNLSVTILKNYSDSERALDFFKDAIKLLMPKHVYIETPEEGRLQQAFGVDEAIIEKFKSELNSK